LNLQEHREFMKIAQNRGVLTQSGDLFVGAMCVLFLDRSVGWHTRMSAMDVEIDLARNCTGSKHSQGREFARKYLSSLEVTELDLSKQRLCEM